MNGKLLLLLMSFNSNVYNTLFIAHLKHPGANEFFRPLLIAEPGLLGLKGPKSKNLTVRSGPRIYDPTTERVVAG